MADKIKLFIAFLVASAGIAGYYNLQQSPAVVKLASVLAGLLLAAGVDQRAGQALFCLWP